MVHSPKVVPKSQSPHSLVDSQTKEKNKRSPGLFIKRLDKLGKKISKEAGSMSPVLTKLETVSILEKSLESHEDDSENLDSIDVKKDLLSSTSSSLAKTRESDFKRDPSKKKFHDIEVASLQKKNEECVSYIDSLLAEINQLKVKAKNAEENSERVFHNWQVSENSIKIMQNIIQNSDFKMKEMQNALRFKEVELEEFKELLKKSEDKRKVANEQVNDFESTLVMFQRQSNKLNSTINELNKEVTRCKNQISHQNQVISELNTQISLLQKDAELEKVKNMNDLIESEHTKQLLVERIEEFELKLEKSESELKKMQEIALKYQKDASLSGSASHGLKRAETSIESRVFSNLSKEEASRWHERYFNLEEELSSLKESLKKYEKNDSYFKSQLSQKNQLIQNLEGTIQTLESSSQSPSLTIRNPLLETSLEILLERLKSFEDHFRCESCAKITEKPFLALPCLHLFCKTCSDFNEKMCSICALKNVIMESVPLIDVSFEMCRNFKEELKRLIELI
jgi:chromosome segregation ATPase